MPTMEEIVGALNSAAEFFDEHGRPSEGSDFADLAAKVEQMRCEACGQHNEWCKDMIECGDGVGCFAWKNKSECA